jgi:hypothetical protein
MALWQYNFYVLPKSSMLNLDSNLTSLKKDDGFDDSIFWANTKINPIFFNPINNFLPIGKS